MKIGIACSPASGKAVFVHGVLAAFAEAGFKAHVYGGASLTAIIAAFAATEQLGMLRGSAYWKERHARATYKIIMTWPRRFSNRLPRRLRH